MATVWVQNEGQALVFLMRNNRLLLSSIATQWNLNPSSLRLGDLFLHPDADGSSIYTVDEIRAFSTAAGLGDGLTKQTAFTIAGQPSIPALSESGVAGELLALYGEKVWLGRGRPPHVVSPDIADSLSMRRIGDTFPIQGREDTYRALLGGSARMFHVFMHPETSRTEHLRDRPFFFGMIAYPGAGKTTMGTRGWTFLRDSWNRLTTAEKLEILSEHLSQEDAQAFFEMAEASLQYNLTLYADLSCCPSLEGLEVGLHRYHILALRLLHAIVNHDDTLPYHSFLQDLQSSYPHLFGPKASKAFNLASVLEFLSRSLRLPENHQQRLMVCMFFDEANAVEPSDGPTWFQQLMSSFVDEAHRIALDVKRSKTGGFMFPVFTYATTRYTAGDLLRTPSARARTIPVPFRLLNQSESVAAVMGFVTCLAKSLHQPPPSQLSESVMYLIRVAGGNPRALAKVLETLAKELPRDRTLLFYLTDRIPHDVAERVVHKLSEDYRDKYNAYLDGKRLELLLRVLAVSLTGHARLPRDPSAIRHRLQLDDVERDSKVLESDSVLYGQLEETGLVALTSPSDVEIAHPGVAPVKVRCSPSLISALVAASPVRWPNLLTQHHRGKELADLQTVVLRIWLCQKVLHRQHFTLGQILSPGAVIPRRLQQLEFSLDAGWGYEVHERSTHFANKEEISAEFSTSNCLAIIAAGNAGFDSILRLQQGNGTVFLVFESKQTTTGKKRGVQELLDNFREDCDKFWKLPGPSEGDVVESGAYEQGVEQRSYNTRSKGDENKGNCSYSVVEVEEAVDKDLKDLVYLFCTNRQPSKGFLSGLSAAQETGRLMRRIIYQCEAEALTYGDALGVVAELRSKKRKLDI